MVDRAANRRKFLIVKREGEPMPTGAAVTAGPNGLTTSAGGAAPAAGTGAGAPLTKAGATLTKDAQKALADCLDEVLSQLEDAQKLIDGAKIVDDETEMDAGPIVESMMGAAEMCEDACYATTPAAASQEETPEVAAQPPQAPNQPGPPLSMGAPFGKRLAVLTAKRVIAKAANVALLRTSLAKYGSKMKKERLARFQSAIDILSSLLGEVLPAAPAEIVATDKAGKPDDKKKKPAAGAAEAPQGPSADNTPPAAMAPNKSKTGKADEVPEAIAKQLVALQAQVTGLTTQIKKNAEAEAARRGAITPSNAAPVEGLPRAVEDVSWPFDMAAAAVEDEKSPNRFG